MPVPYRRTPEANAERTFYAGLLIVDGKGQPIEFVHNAAKAPAGLLWPEETIVKTGIPALAHSLFDACRREPDLVVMLPRIGSPETVRNDIAPSVPCAQVVPTDGDLPPEWNWINTPPTTGMRAAILADELVRRGFLIEPFDRLLDALRLIYPEIPPQWDDDDA